MTTLDIKIQAISDLPEGAELKNGMTEDNSTELQEMTIAIQEKGTEGGQTSLMFIMEPEPGKFLYKQITAQIMEELVGSYYGAYMRFRKEQFLRGEDPYAIMVEAGMSICSGRWETKDNCGECQKCKDLAPITDRPMTTGIICNNYKLGKFKEALNEAGFTNYETSPQGKDLTVIKVHITEDKLSEVQAICNRMEVSFSPGNRSNIN